MEFDGTILTPPVYKDVLASYDRMKSRIEYVTDMKPEEIARACGFPEMTIDAIRLDPRDAESCLEFRNKHFEYDEDGRKHEAEEATNPYSHNMIGPQSRSRFEYYHTIALNMVMERVLVKTMAESWIEVKHPELFDKQATLEMLSNDKFSVNGNPDLELCHGGLTRRLEIQNDYCGFTIDGNPRNRDANGNLYPIYDGFIDFRMSKLPALSEKTYESDCGITLKSLFVNIDWKNKKAAVIDFAKDVLVSEILPLHYNFKKKAYRVFVKDNDIKVYDCDFKKKSPLSFLVPYLDAKLDSNIGKLIAFQESEYEKRRKEHVSHKDFWLGLRSREAQLCESAKEMLLPL